MKPIAQVLKELTKEIKNLREETDKRISAVEDKVGSGDDENFEKFKSDISGRIDDLGNEIEKMHGSLMGEKDNRQELEERQKKISELEKSVESIRKEEEKKDSWKAEKTEKMSESLKSLQKEIKDLKSAKSKIFDHIAKLDSSLEESEKSDSESVEDLKFHAEVGEKIERMEGRLKELSSRLVDAEKHIISKKKLESMEKDMKRMKDMQSKGKPADEDYEKLKSDLEESVSDIRSETEKRMGEMKSSTEKLSGLKKEIDERMRKAGGDYGERIKKLETSVRELVKDISAVKDSKSRIFDHIAKLENSVRDSKKPSPKIQREIDKLDREIRKIKKSSGIAKTKKELKDLLFRIDEMRKENEEWLKKNKIDELMNKIGSRVDEKVYQMEEQIKGVGGIEKISDIGNSLGSLEKEIEDLKVREGVDTVKTKKNKEDMMKMTDKMITKIRNTETRIDKRIDSVENRTDQFAKNLEEFKSEDREIKSIKDALSDLDSRVESMGSRLGEDDETGKKAWREVKTLLTDMKMLEDRVSKVELKGPGTDKHLISDIQVKLKNLENSFSALSEELEELKWKEKHGKDSEEIAEELRKTVSEMENKVNESRDEMFRMRSEIENDIDEKLEMVRRERRSVLGGVKDSVSELSEFERRMKEMETSQERLRSSINDKFSEISNKLSEQIKRDRERSESLVKEKARDISEFKEKVKGFVNELVRDYQKRFEILNRDLERVAKEIKTEKMELDNLMDEKMMKSGKDMKERIENMKSLLEEESPSEIPGKSRKGKSVPDSDIESIREKLEDIRGDESGLGPVKKKITDLEEKLDEYGNSGPVILE